MRKISIALLFPIAFSLLLLVVGCSRKVAPSITIVEKDSVASKITPRNVAVTLPGDSVTVEGLIEVEKIKGDSLHEKTKPLFKTEHWKAKSKTASVDVKVDAKGKITAKANCDSLTTVVQAMDKELFHYRKESKKEVEVREVYKTRQIDIVCRWITGITLLLFIGILAGKYLKFNPLR